MTPVFIEVELYVCTTRNAGNGPKSLVKTMRRDWQLVEHPVIGGTVEYPSIGFKVKVDNITHRVCPDEIVISGSRCSTTRATNGGNYYDHIASLLKSVGFVEVEEESSDGK